MLCQGLNSQEFEELDIPVFIEGFGRKIGLIMGRNKKLWAFPVSPAYSTGV